VTKQERERPALAAPPTPPHYVTWPNRHVTEQERERPALAAPPHYVTWRSGTPACALPGRNYVTWRFGHGGPRAVI
jgi:hypothetical protein